MQAQQQGICSRCLEDFPKGTKIVPHDGGWMHESCSSGQDDMDQSKPAKKTAPAPKVDLAAVEPAPRAAHILYEVPEIPADGLVLRDLDEPTYHAHPTSLSVSGAKVMRLAPALYNHQRHHPVTKDEYDIGSAAHLYVLGTGPEIVELVTTMADGTQKIATDRRSPSVARHADDIRKAGKLPLMAKDHAKVKEMAKALLEHPFAAKLLSAGESEVSGFKVDPHTGVLRRGRADRLRKRVIIDYKSAVDANPAKLGKVAHNNGWYMQDPFYTDLFRDLGWDIDRFLFVVQEKTAPYLVSVVAVEERGKRLGRDHNREALEKWRDCTESGVWPGYQADGQPTVLSMPSYAYTPTVTEVTS